jgi:DNA repair protein RadC
MKRVATQDRPREKLERLGAAALGDNELLAIVLGHGAAHAGALDLANTVLAVAGGLHGLARASMDELRQVPGIGAVRAAQLVAAIEAGRRTLIRGPRHRHQIITPRDAAELLIPEFGSRAVEQFGIMLLDTKHRVLRIKIISIGTLDSTAVHPREVFREATTAGASSIVLFHNHPSGDPTPSPEDLQLTLRLMRAGELMGITVLDHLVLSDVQFCSLKPLVAQLVASSST